MTHNSNVHYLHRCVPLLDEIAREHGIEAQVRSLSDMRPVRHVAMPLRARAGRERSLKSPPSRATIAIAAYCITVFCLTVAAFCIGYFGGRVLWSAF